MKTPSAETLAQYVERGLITRDDREHLSLFNYTSQCVYSAAWDDVTMMCRGLIIDRRDWSVAALPFPKFFNFGEHGIEQDIPDRPPDVTTIKHDGSLGISYLFDGEICWSTRGRFGSPQSVVAQQMWEERHSRVHIPSPWTVMVEIIHPETKVVVDYAWNGLVCLGIRNRLTGEDLPYHSVQRWCDSVGLPVVECGCTDLEEALKMAQEMDDQREGFVLRWGDYRLKVKSVEYCRVARLLKGLTDRAIADLWYAEVNPHDLKIPAEMRDAMLERYSELSVIDRDVCFEISTAAVPNLGMSRKDFAIAFKGHELFGCMMALFSDKRPDTRKAAYIRVLGSKPRPVDKFVGVSI